MGMELAKVVVGLRADLRRLQKDLDKSQGIIKSSAKKSAGIFRSVLSAGLVQQGIFRAIGEITDLVFEAQELARVQIEAEAGLAATLEATGNAAGFTAEQLKQYASNLQAATTIGDEAILESMTTLASFKAVSGDVFKRTTEAAMDMSIVLKKSLPSAMLQLGKAIEDPSVGLSRLTIAGIQFSEEQQEIIKDLQKSGKLLEAQALILDKVEGKYKGVARAMAKTETGQLDQINNKLGDMKEILGVELIGVVLEFKKTFLSMVEEGQVKVDALIMSLRFMRVLLSRKFGEALGQDFAIAFTKATGSDFFGPLEVLEDDLRRTKADIARMFRGEQTAGGGRPALAPPAAGAGLGKTVEDTRNLSGVFGLPELSQRIQESLLDDKQDTMINLMEANNKLQENQLKQQQQLNDSLLIRVIPARVAPG